MNSRVRALKEDYLWRARKNLIGFLSIFCLKYYVLLCLILAAKSALFDYFQILLHSYYDLIKSRYIYIHTRVVTATFLSRALFIIRGVTHLTSGVVSSVFSLVLLLLLFVVVVVVVEAATLSATPDGRVPLLCVRAILSP